MEKLTELWNDPEFKKLSDKFLTDVTDNLNKFKLKLEESEINNKKEKKKIIKEN